MGCCPRKQQVIISSASCFCRGRKKKGGRAEMTIALVPQITNTEKRNLL